MPKDDHHALDPNSVLSKVMQVLNSFASDDDGLRFAQIQKRVDLPRSTLHRTLSELVKTRLLDRDETGRYRLGGQLFELGMRASVERTLLEVATPFLTDLYERSHETVHLGVREGIEVVYVAKIGGHQQARMPSRLGGRMPLHATAIGKALLAHAGPTVRGRVLHGELDRYTPRTITQPGILQRQLAKILDYGPAFEYEESAHGIACVAAAVLDRDESAIAAVSLTGPILRFRPEKHATSVQAAAAGIAATLARRAELLAP